MLAGVLFGDFLPAGALSLELSEDDELELDSFLAAPLLAGSVVLAAAGVSLTARAAVFPLLLMAYAGGFCAGFSGAGSSSELDETSELGELDGDGDAPLILAGLALGIGVDILGGCSVRFHLLAAGPGSGSHCVRTS